jgi:putative membrane protein
VLPVGTLVEARLLLERIAPGAPEPRRRPPRRARWKSPLRYRRLAFGLDETYAVATTGRLLAQSTAWVPLTKVQSLRRVQGPVQRAFGLATVHLDTAGKNVGSAFRDLDASEAEAELMRLVDLARDARRASIL